jgi:hypothetical protein
LETGRERLEAIANFSPLAVPIKIDYKAGIQMFLQSQ